MPRTLSLALSISLLILSSSLSAAEPASLSGESSVLSWHVNVPFERATLSLRGPDGLFIAQEFSPAQTLRFALMTADGQPLPDGRYAYELDLLPVLSESARSALEEVQSTGDAGDRAHLRRSGLLPSGDLRMSGGFALIGGVLRGSGLEEHEPNHPEPQDDVIADDVIVQGNLCVGGFGCTNGEVFGSDDLKLEDTRLGILFEDSSSASFPTHDWRILVNDGLDEFFAVEDVETTRIPFRITPGTKSDAFVIAGDEADSRNTAIGIGTATPARAIHVKTSDTPSLRLEQDGSGGFLTQTWDIRANESRFVIEDVNALTVPFRIDTGAPEDSFFITGTGDVGIGLSQPEEKLHVDGGLIVDGDFRVGSSAKIKRDLEPVVSAELLETLEEIELFRWSYEADASRVRHLGPLAEDFHRSFGLGQDGRHLSPSDVAGVALAAVKALQGELQRRDDSLRRLEDTLDRREAQLDRLNDALEELQQQVREFRAGPS